jgi:hypothetical protein
VPGTKPYKLTEGPWHRSKRVVDRSSGDRLGVVSYKPEFSNPMWLAEDSTGKKIPGNCGPERWGTREEAADAVYAAARPVDG